MVPVRRRRGSHVADTSRAKTEILQARPECSLLILDLQNPYRYLELRGRARIEPDDDYAFAARLGAKYGADVREHDGPGESRLVVTIEPTKVYAVDMSGLTLCRPATPRGRL